MNINKIFTKIAFALAFVFFATVAAAQEVYQIPKSGQTNVTIPEGVTEFKVTHTPIEGGEYDGYYFVDYNGSLLVTVPEGYKMTVKGNAYISQWSSMRDYLQIYDGNTSDAESLGQFWCTYDIYPRHVSARSTSNQLLFYFYADNSGYDRGFTLTVTIYNPNDPTYFQSDDNGDTYTIHTDADWHKFCDALQNDIYNHFYGKTVKLGADITVTQMAAGSEKYGFDGIFDGQGHTITLDGNTTNGCYALFYSTNYYTKKDPCVIKNLHVTGTIITANTLAAGLISRNNWDGLVEIENCRVSVVIKSEVSGIGKHGGLVGLNEGKGFVTIKGCVFDGKILSTGATTTTQCGGFVGNYISGYKQSTSITNSLYAPAIISSGETEVATSKTFSYDYSYSKSTITNSYYTRTLGTAQGAKVYTITADEHIEVAFSGTETGTEYDVSGITVYTKGVKYDNKLLAVKDASITLSPAEREGYIFNGYESSDVTITDNTFTMPEKDVTITGKWLKLLTNAGITVSAIPDQSYTGSAIEPKVEVKDGETTLVLGTDYTVEYSNNTIGTATATITGIGNYSGEVKKNFTILPDPAHFSQDDDTYTIHTTTGWDMFCDALQNNETYNRFSGKTVKLDADIAVTRMAGSDYHDFCGIFDGQGHTITLDGNTTNGCYALFRNVSTGKVNATDENDTPSAIKNLHVTGTVSAGNIYASGLISKKWGTVTIKNCRVSVTISSGVAGGGAHAGLVAVNNDDVNIIGCVFDGKILSTGATATTSCGGFIGRNTIKTAASISNSLYAPVAIGSGETEVTTAGYTFSRNVATITNSYYIRTLGTEQGDKVYTITADEHIEVAFSGTESGTEYDVSGITVYTKGIKYDNKLLAVKDASITLRPIDGYIFNGYESNDVTITDNAFTMPEKDVTITGKCLKLLTNTDITVSDISDQAWSGSAIKPEVEVKDGETTLVLGTDYTVEYSDNIITGTATATITGKGNYSGEVEKKFTIVDKVTESGALTITENQDGKTVVFDGNYTANTIAYSLENDIENVNVTFNRTFTNGVTSTIVLPFDIEADGYSGGDFYEFTGVDAKKWEATMRKVTSVTAHTPYLFVPSGSTFTITQKVTLKANTQTSVSKTINGWTFIGVYQKKVWGANNTGKNDYCFSAKSSGSEINAGDFVRIGKNVTVKAFRCYLTQGNGTSKSAPVLPESIKVRLIDEVSSVITPDEPNDNSDGDIETPVSEILPGNNVKVWSSDKTIVIEASAGQRYQIIDLNGRTLKNSVTVSDREEVVLNRSAQGVLIVKIANKSFKILY